MSVDTLKRYKDLANAIPEIQTLVETGIVTPTTARAIMKKLPEFQQKELAEQFAEKGEKYSPKIKRTHARRDTQRKPLKKKIRQKKITKDENYLTASQLYLLWTDNATDTPI